MVRRFGLPMVFFDAALTSQSGALNMPVEHSAIVPVSRPEEEWLERHNQFNERVKQGNVDLIFVGDSITHAWESEGKEVWAQYYEKRNAVNLGIGGDQTQHVLWRLDNGNIDGINPKLAVLLIGTNNVSDNTAEEIGEGIRTIVQKLHQKLPETKILVLAIFPRYEKPDAMREKLTKASQIASKMADNRNVFFMDIGNEFTNPDGSLLHDIMPDFLHPVYEGYVRWAKAIEPQIARLMGE